MLWKEYNFKEIIAISDPHAHYNTLISLIESIRKIHPTTPIFILGDMIDKGKRAKDLIDFVMSTENVYALLGNHDHLMIVESRPYWKRYESLWLYNNGDMTHRSYGGKWKIQNRDDNRLSFYKHLNWIKTLPLVVNFPNIIINGKELVLSHSGLDKSVILAGGIEKLKKILNENSPTELLKNHLKDVTTNEQRIALEVLWNVLPEGHNMPDLGIFNVFGHTTQKEVLVKENFACIDTKVYGPNKLSAIHLPSMEIFEQPTLEDSWGEKA